MTVVAYRNGVMASDSRVTDGTMIIPAGMRKLWRLADGSLLGGSGTTYAIEAFARWAKRGRRGSPPEVSKDANMLLVTPAGVVWEYDGAHPWQMREPCEYAAIGSGWRVAMTALWLGHTAVEAVHAAIALDSACGGDVQILHLEREN